MGTRLYVGNLPYSATKTSLGEAFAASGEVTDVHIVMDRESGQSRGFGFVTMGSPAEAQQAIEQMNGALFEGRPLRVNEAEERTPRGGGGGGYSGGGGGGGYGGGGGGGYGGGGGGGYGGGGGGGGGGRGGRGGRGGGGGGYGGGGGGRGGRDRDRDRY
ncbi:RNA recognition motif domain-containing protein [Chondromyces crocatus]|uniref:RNA-binding protein n=1 Tax=Chondromyces crocatus TaxID=52 RepID=A0A0K1E950_CHOCO|nr:RNA-binding protein [Chondromyces crocatus]AKT37088.1 RNA-binding protein [Chondromyces crocatus]